MPEKRQNLQSLKLWGSLAVCAFSGAVVLTWPGSSLNTDAAGRLLLRGAPYQASQTARQPVRSQVSQRIRETGGIITADYTFVNFNNDQLALSFAIPAKDLAAYRLEYGYTPAEKTALDQWQKNAVEEAYRTAVKNRQNQEQLNSAGERIAAEYKAKLAAFYKSRGFTMVDGNVLVADIPEIVRRNIRKAKPIALSLNSTAEKLGYDSDSTVTAALSLVQTALLYESVPSEIKGRQTGGIYPPLETAAVGKGDCDTKSALLASILLNWNRIKVVGVGVPGHYLVGIMRNPAKGDAFIEYKGLKYVLMEPAGPGWLPPGVVDKRTLSLLGAAERIRIELFNSN